MKDFYQEKNISYIEERYGTEEFVQVCGRRKLNDADASFWCGLVKSEHIQEIFKSVGLGYSLFGLLSWFCRMWR